ncbi:hypothetical protein [Pseudomonas sp. ATCC 13867]|uniref:hypothetical protein n=1 Tax=Pseudomonas sp. ATCC 13867 TaxID=1294143 RepID=UPI0003475A6D|nr:hypothetical protein [Pseudomonas sp. ATCC 13867]
MRRIFAAVLLILPLTGCVIHEHDHDRGWHDRDWNDRPHRDYRRDYHDRDHDRYKGWSR